MSASCADLLNAVQEVEDPAGEKRSGLGVIERQRTVGEVVVLRAEPAGAKSEAQHAPRECFLPPDIAPTSGS
jgi:hypothetical protein